MTLAVLAFLCCPLSAHAQDWAKARLEKSPRHQEWVDIKYGNRTVHAFVVYPEVKSKAPAVLVIHEIFGLTDWARSAADRWRRQGTSRLLPICFQDLAPKGAGRAISPALTMR